MFNDFFFTQPRNCDGDNLSTMIRAFLYLGYDQLGLALILVDLKGQCHLYLFYVYSIFYTGILLYTIQIYSFFIPHFYTHFSHFHICILIFSIPNLFTHFYPKIYCLFFKTALFSQYFPNLSTLFVSKREYHFKTCCVYVYGG